MSRQAATYEKTLFEIIQEYRVSFYYKSFYRVVDAEHCRIKAEKAREEMVGRAYVSFENRDRVDYELRYNRIVNLSEGYTLFVPGIKAG